MASGGATFLKWILVPVVCLGVGYFIAGPVLVQVAPDKATQTAKLTRDSARTIKSTIKQAVPSDTYAEETKQEEQVEKKSSENSKPKPDTEAPSETKTIVDGDQKYPVPQLQVSVRSADAPRGLVTSDSANGDAPKKPKKKRRRKKKKPVVQQEAPSEAPTQDSGSVGGMDGTPAPPTGGTDGN